MSIDAQIGERITQARIAAGLSVSALSDMLGMDATLLLAMETAQVRIDAKSICRLAKALDQDIHWFFESPEEESARANETSACIQGTHPNIAFISQGLRRNENLQKLCEWAVTAQYTDSKTSNVA